jgi:hypothetical protein
VPLRRLHDLFFSGFAAIVRMLIIRQGLLSGKPQSFLLLWSQRSAHSAEQPANSQCNGGSRVGLSFDRVAKPGIKCRRGLTSRVSGLPIQLLRSTRRLVHCTFALRFSIACYSADVFLKPTAILADSTFNSIFVHDLSPVGWRTQRLAGRSGNLLNLPSEGQADFQAAG